MLIIYGIKSAVAQLATTRKRVFNIYTHTYISIRNTHEILCNKIQRGSNTNVAIVATWQQAIYVR